MRILLIVGGWSSEREVSILGGKSISKALTENGHKVTWFDLQDNFDKLCQTAKQHDFSFINLHGSPGEDGIVQALLEQSNCPYQGSNAKASMLALNKVASKQIFRNNGLLTPDWEFLPKPMPSAWQPSIAYPICVKSNTGGSSLNLAMVNNKQELDTILNEIFSISQEAVLEKAIEGEDLTCGILGQSPLPPILIKPIHAKYFDYKSKYAKGGAEEICPAPIADNITAEVQAITLKVHNLLGLSGYSRSDFILTPTNELYLLEVNTLPGMTATSLIPQEAAAIGLNFANLLERLIELGLNNKS